MRTKSRTYNAVVLRTPAALADEAGGILVAHGAIGCEVKRIAGAPRGKREQVYLHAYFERIGPAAVHRIGKLLAAAGMLTSDCVPTLHRVDDPGWATMWQARFEPFTVGERFLIVPPWNRAHHRARIQLVIKPGQAFGTGHHASTYGTLALIEQLCGDRVKRALDVGTGSGILALAMASLGVRDVTAIDIDPTALENARENAALNRLDGAIRFLAAPIASVRGRFDLIVANILSSVVLAMAPQLKARMRPHAHLVLAGILAREADAVVAGYITDLKLIASRRDGKWVALAFQR